MVATARVFCLNRLTRPSVASAATQVLCCVIHNRFTSTSAVVHAQVVPVSPETPVRPAASPPRSRISAKR